MDLTLPNDKRILEPLQKNSKYFARLLSGTISSTLKYSEDNEEYTFKLDSIIDDEQWFHFYYFLVTRSFLSQSNVQILCNIFCQSVYICLSDDYINLFYDLINDFETYRIYQPWLEELPKIDAGKYTSILNRMFRSDKKIGCRYLYVCSDYYPRCTCETLEECRFNNYLLSLMNNLGC